MYTELGPLWSWVWRQEPCRQFSTDTGRSVGWIQTVLEDRSEMRQGVLAGTEPNGTERTARLRTDVR